MLEDWAVAVRRELGLPAEAADAGSVALVLDVARDVAHGVTRPAAPLTVYLLGLAVGRSGADGPTAPELATQVTDLVASWAPRQPADEAAE